MGFVCEIVFEEEQSALNLKRKRKGTLFCFIMMQYYDDCY